MTDLGDCQRGQELSVPCQVTDGVEPEWPDAAPVLSLYNGSTLVLRQKMPVDAGSQIPGFFRLPVFLDARFPDSGLIIGLVQWTNGGTVFGETLAFRILPGGSIDGSVIAMTYVRRPSSGFLVWQTDAGNLYKGSNPRVRT